MPDFTSIKATLAPMVGFHSALARRPRLDLVILFLPSFPSQTKSSLWGNPRTQTASMGLNVGLSSPARGSFTAIFYPLETLEGICPLRYAVHRIAAAVHFPSQAGRNVQSPQVLRFYEAWLHGKTVTRQTWPPTENFDVAIRILLSFRC